MTAFSDDDVAEAASVFRIAWHGDDGCRTDEEAVRIILAAVAPAMRDRWRQETADEMDAYRAEVYPDALFRRPTTEEYAEINALLFAERGHKLDGIAADCMDRAIRVQAERLRARADAEEGK